MRETKRCATKIRTKAVGGAIFGHFSNFDKGRLVVDDVVISSVAVEYLGIDVFAKCVDYRLNNVRIIRLYGRPEPLHALLCSI